LYKTCKPAWAARAQSYKNSNGPSNVLPSTAHPTFCCLCLVNGQPSLNTIFFQAVAHSPRVTWFLTICV
jgi:hypothetical protein